MLNNNKNICKDINCPIQGVPANAVSIVESVSKEECALALLIEAQADLLCKAINKCISVCDFKDIINSIIQTMKTIAIKNNTLENKLRETLNFIQKEGIECLDYNRQFELLNSLNSVLECIDVYKRQLYNYLYKNVKRIVRRFMANFFNINNENTKKATLQDDVVIQQTPGLNEAAAFNVVGSIAAEENALAALIQEEADKLASLTGDALTFDNFTELTESIIRTLKTILLKNTVLEAKLTETLNYIDEEGFTITSDFVDNITAILSRIANEENALGNLIGAIGTLVDALAPVLAFEQLQAADELILAILRVITEKNLVLLSKLRRVVRFIINNSEDFPTPTQAQVDAVIAALNALINAIRVEENGLAVLIDAEAAKLNRAIELTTTAGGVDDLLDFNDIITSALDIIVQKNMILEAKLEDIIAIITLGNGFNDEQLAGFAVSLSNLQQSIANEEFALANLIGTEALKTVSYTHLDVYKRQVDLLTLFPQSAVSSLPMRN